MRPKYAKDITEWIFSSSSVSMQPQGSSNYILIHNQHFLYLYNTVTLSSNNNNIITIFLSMFFEEEIVSLNYQPVIFYILYHIHEPVVIIHFNLYCIRNKDILKYFIFIFFSFLCT
jgi:hypothetical protein